MILTIFNIKVLYLLLKIFWASEIEAITRLL